MIEHIAASLQEAHHALTALQKNEATLRQIAQAAHTMVSSFKQGGKVYACGNGGSMCDAMHFAEELTGRYRKNRPGVAAIAISDPSHLTCVANDFGYEQVFARYIESHARPGDCLIAISTSGKSPNIIAAVNEAKARGVTSIVLTGKKDSPLEQLADITICTPGGEFADRVQELHIKVLHIFIELIERQFFAENYQ